MPIKTNSTVLTTGKTYPGGERGGCFKFLYCSIDPWVSRAESPPTPRLMTRLIRSGFNLIMAPILSRWFLLGQYMRRLLQVGLHILGQVGLQADQTLGNVLGLLFGSLILVEIPV